MGRKLLTTAEIAERVRAPQSTVRYWRHIGQGPRGVRVGRRVLYDEADVDAWIEEQYDNDDDPRAA